MDTHEKCCFSYVLDILSIIKPVCVSIYQDYDCITCQEHEGTLICQLLTSVYVLHLVFDLVHMYSPAYPGGGTYRLLYASWKADVHVLLIRYTFVVVWNKNLEKKSEFSQKDFCPRGGGGNSLHPESRQCLCQTVVVVWNKIVKNLIFLKNVGPVWVQTVEVYTSGIHIRGGGSPPAPGILGV